MSRPDLLALDDDDLAAIATRGALRRARHDADGGAVTVAEQEDGTLRATVGGQTVTLPPARALDAADCSCPATAVCRHVVAAVLAYRALHGDAQQRADDGPWDPGALDDATLAAAARTARDLARARALLAAGSTWTAVRDTRPWATLHDEDRTILFPVPGAIVHARCSCAQPAPCVHALAAALAFRALPAGERAGTIETARPPAPPPPPGCAEALRQLAEHGAVGGARTLADELAAAAQACRRDGLTAVAACAEELTELVRRHAAGDATYDPAELADLVGETELRRRLLAADARWPPRAFLAGIADERAHELRGGRLVGLGTSVRRRGATIELAAHLADLEGVPSALVATSADPPQPQPPRSFAALAATEVRGVPLHVYGAGQVVARGARRSASRRISFGRRPVSVTPQAFAWEELLGPGFAADAAAVRAAALARPPAPIALRHAVAAPVALAVSAVAGGFSHARQAIVAAGRDRAGERLFLDHPFLTRASAGCEALLAALGGSDERVVLVAGIPRALDPLVLAPTAIVLERRDGARRMLQPWTEQAADGPATSAETAAASAPLALEEPDATFAAARTLLGALLTGGARRSDGALAAQARAVADRFAALRSVRLHAAAARLAAALELLAGAPRDVDPAAAVGAALDLAALLRLARDLECARPSAALEPLSGG